MALIKPLLNARGFTLMEILVATLLMGVVLAGAMSIFVSGARFMQNTHNTAVNANPPSLNQITRLIDVGYTAYISQGVSQLNIGCDCTYDPATNTVTPVLDGPGGVDTWFHFRIMQGGTNTTIRWAIDNDRNYIVNANPQELILFQSIDRDSSSFQMINPTLTDADTVVQTIIAFNNPATGALLTTLKTQTAVGAGAKR